MKKSFKKIILPLAICALAVPFALEATIVHFVKANEESIIPKRQGQEDVFIDYVECSDEPLGESSEFDDSTKYDYSTITPETRSGGFHKEGNEYVTDSANTIVSYDTVPFSYGTFEVTISGTSNSSDDGIIFSVSDNNRSTYWEDKNVYYYFFFLGHDGYAALGKVANKTWTSVFDYNFGSFSTGTSYTLKVIKRNKLIIFYINGTMINYIRDGSGMDGTKFGLRAGSSGVRYSDVNVSSEYIY